MPAPSPGATCGTSQRRTARSTPGALGAIAAALADADALVLATDPDREGEAIAWQVLEWLRDKGALEGKAVPRTSTRRPAHGPSLALGGEPACTRTASRSGRMARRRREPRRMTGS